jgi:hypothetical protein
MVMDGMEIVMHNVEENTTLHSIGIYSKQEK